MVDIFPFFVQVLCFPVKTIENPEPDRFFPWSWPYQGVAEECTSSVPRQRSLLIHPKVTS